MINDNLVFSAPCTPRSWKEFILWEIYDTDSRNGVILKINAVVQWNTSRTAVSCLNRCVRDKLLITRVRPSQLPWFKQPVKQTRALQCSKFLPLSAPFAAVCFFFFFLGRSDPNRQEQVIKIRAYFLLGGVKFGNSCLLSPQGDAQMDRGVPDKTWYVCALRFGNGFLNLLPDLTISWPARVLEMEIQRAEFAHHPATH